MASAESTRTRILLVEDEPAIADTITYALTTDGFEPTWCTTGQAALAALGRTTFGLVIVDVGLPDINGFDLFREIQARWRVPVIFLTARTSEIDRVVGLELGADDYVPKPFSPRELCARVRTVLRRVARSAVPDPASPPAGAPPPVEEDPPPPRPVVDARGAGQAREGLRRCPEQWRAPVRGSAPHRRRAPGPGTDRPG